MALRLQASLQDLAERGITADKLTAEELEALVYACSRVDNPYTDINAELCEHPVKVCRGLYLWPITAGAQIWLTDYAETWWKKGSTMYRWAQVFALHNARNADAFCNLTDKRTARRAILKCLLRFVCHRSELTVAINRCYGIHYHDTPKDRKPRENPEQAQDWARYVAGLEVKTGVPAKYWLWGRSLVLMAQTFDKMRAVANAFAKGDALEQMDYEFNDALENLQRVKSRIVWRFENGGKQGT